MFRQIMVPFQVWLLSSCWDEKKVEIFKIASLTSIFMLTAPKVGFPKKYNVLVYNLFLLHFWEENFASKIAYKVHRKKFWIYLKWNIWRNYFNNRNQLGSQKECKRVENLSLLKVVVIYCTCRDSGLHFATDQSATKYYWEDRHIVSFIPLL